MSASCGNHFCQFHNSSASLSNAVCDFVEEGLKAGDAVVVVGTEERIARIETHLAEVGLASLHGQQNLPLTLVESGSLLAKITDINGPRESEFNYHVAPLLNRARGNPGRKLRVFGEMVNDLVGANRKEHAMHLEQLWNRLAERIEFTLFCGYVMDCLDPSSYDSFLKHICDTHNSVVPTHEDDSLRQALDISCEQAIGSSLSTVLSATHSHREAWEKKLPLSRRMILWLYRNAPSYTPSILDAVRRERDRRTDLVIDLVK